MTRILLKTSVLALAVSSFAFGDALELYAQGEFVEGKYRISLASRQKMLSQRIAMTACFVELDIEKDRNLEKLRRAHDVFDSSLKELRDGGGEHDIGPEKDRRTLEGLTVVDEHWVDFSKTIQDVLAKGEVTYEDEEDILYKNVMALEDMEMITALIKAEYANPNEMMLDAAIAMNIVSRQRVLLQKATKEFCYLVGGHHVEEERELLEATHNLFNTSMDALISGMPSAGLKAPPTEEIANELVVIQEVWGAMDKIFERALAGEEISKEEIEFVATENSHLLEEMNKVVGMYLSL
ncbi:type IV pili methyl-accepting chemotaxis transducer N-terminal domain-containing protein [Halovulum sp. GXIMD14793]